MKKAERFSIYRHSFVYGNNLIVVYIVEDKDVN